jgi:hypothetical protein
LTLNLASTIQKQTPPTIGIDSVTVQIGKMSKQASRVYSTNTFIERWPKLRQAKSTLPSWLAPAKIAR